MNEEITTMLERLAELHSAKDIIELDKQRAIDAVLTPEIKAALADIEFEFGEMVDAAQGSISELEAEVKAAVIDAGETVKSDRLQAVFAKGRVSWDTKALDGYLVAHPELEPLRKVGQPSVSIRWNK